jgi:hypothetical protein
VWRGVQQPPSLAVAEGMAGGQPPPAQPSGDSHNGGGSEPGGTGKPAEGPMPTKT